MSGMIPKQLVRGIQQHHGVTLDAYGADCTLFLPANVEDVDHKDRYGSTYDLQFNAGKPEKVWIYWEPSIKLLKSFGLYGGEDDAPIIASFKQGLIIPQRSYFEIDIESVPEKYGTHQFEITESLAGSIHQQVILKSYKIAPRKARD